ncbi:MAG TPA: carboxypeptidase-like regulatory domain-containing protein [Thermoanaerobaculia bacterium]|nr:carboxypeptidase-like regulatory domain-containing protein [Thermoanaerobaculia bacterium]
MKALALLFALAVAPLLAGDESHFAPPGEISIIVYETNGHPLPGATVTLENSAHKAVKILITSADGAAQFQHLAAGNYYVIAQLSGFFDQMTGPIPVVVDPPSLRLPDKLRLVLNSGPVWIDTVISVK